MSNDDCGAARQHLYTYLDSELDEAAATSIRAHLDECPPCLGSFDFERRLKLVIRRCLDEDVPEGLVDKVRDLIHREIL